MPKLHTTLEPDDVILIPSGAGASIRLIEKSGKRSRVEIECNSPVTITRASNQPAANSAQRIARRPVPSVR